ncbi:Sexual differentiation process protein ISP4 [Ceraceosorus bombacis]|uniref:Sexual differentiation process protein ISP4 n=1 Tax=Ceraceosorus bombacis TaxID=401625 RepID=A0A0P1BCV2_9BASI|nr:Sexual differentiation process protein ISP4 [Ceraceosorus bombacis]
MTALTLRGVIMGSIFATAGAAVAQTFFYKSNSPSFSSYMVILVSLPLGRWLARVTPKRDIWIPLIGYVALNPGDFSIKEHLLVTVVSSSGASSAYAADILNIQDLFYHTKMSIPASLALLLTTQTLGFGFAGLVHSILVKPVAMVFPGTLVTTTMFNTLHGAHSADTKPRLRFFAFAFVAIFIYQFIPALIMPTLTSVSLLCLFNNESRSMRILGSGMKGFGLLNFSLDWTAVGAAGPLYTPLWAALNYYAGIMGAMFVVMPCLYFLVGEHGFWDAQKFDAPLGAGLYGGDYKKFNVSSVLDSKNMLDPTKWKQNSPLLLTPWFALSYGISFATLTSMITHVVLWHRKDIMKAIFAPPGEDIHNRLMKAYQPVPKSWYVATLAISLSTAILLVATSPLQITVTGLLLAVSIALIFLVPVGLIKAVSDTVIGLNVVTEFVAGLLWPGRPVGNVAFKCYGYMAMSQALDLTTDLKLAHYMKIPPRHMFVAQTIGTVIGCCVNLAVVRLILSPDAGYRVFLTGEKVDPTGQWDGRKVHIFYSASIIWGAIAPARFFVGNYVKLYFGFLIGFLLPVLPWLLNKRFPRKWWQQINFPVLLHGAGLPPQVPTNIISSGFIAAIFSQYWMRKHHPKFFAKRNYVLSAALDAGTSINALVLFFMSVTILKVVPMPRWWGNPAADSEHCLPAGGTNGPAF